MKIPYARYTGESGFEQVTGMARDEVKFEKFIYAITKQFAKIIKQIFIQHIL